MYFRDSKKELPKAYKAVLVKFKSGMYDIAYYSNIHEIWHPELNDEVSYDPKNVVGWIPLSELDSIEIK